MNPYFELVQQLGVVQATAFSMYLKAHNYHWNVTGPNFSEYHKFLEDVYTAVWESVDDYAEHIRALDSFPSGGLAAFIRTTRIQDASETLTPALAMFKQLEDDNRILQEELNKAHDLAVEAGAYGVINFLEGQIDYHDKLHWMLRAFTPAVM
jgi:starvation-inducible DNA-binding protein